MMNDMIEFLKNEGVSPDLVREVQEFANVHPASEKFSGRVPVPKF